MPPRHRVGPDVLSTHLLELACMHVADRGGFAPFGGCVGPDGKIVLLEGEPATVSEQIRAIGSEIGMTLVASRVADPRTHQPTDCILFTTENAHGVAVHGYLPYTRTEDEVAFGDYFLSPLPAY